MFNTQSYLFLLFYISNVVLKSTLSYGYVPTNTFCFISDFLSTLQFHQYVRKKIFKHSNKFSLVKILIEARKYLQKIKIGEIKDAYL